MNMRAIEYLECANGCGLFAVVHGIRTCPRCDLIAAASVKPKPAKTAQNRPKEASSIEQAFIHAWQALNLPMPIAEYRFHPTRRWRFDYAFPELKLAIELDGGGWTYGRHHRPQGYAADCEKLNAAIELGWRVLRYTKVDAQAIEQVARVYKMLDYL